MEGRPSQEVAIAAPRIELVIFTFSSFRLGWTRSPRAQSDRGNAAAMQNQIRIRVHAFLFLITEGHIDQALPGRR